MFNLNQSFIVVGLLIALLELLMGGVAGFDLVLVGTILILGGLVGGVFGSTYVTLGVSIVLGIAYLWFGRAFLRKKMVVITKRTNIDKLIGQRGLVVRSITPDTAGMVRLEDEDWRASSEEVLFEKDKVEVESIEGVTLKVKKIK